MPGIITVPEFIRETREDFASPTTSTFVTRIPQCRETVTKIDEVRTKIFSDTQKYFTASTSISYQRNHFDHPNSFYNL